MKGHAEEVIRLDVALIDCILWVVRLTLGTSLSVICIPMVINQSFPYGSIINRILEHF